MTDQHKAPGKRMPVLFVGHGSPMNAVEDNEFSAAWTGLSTTLPRPQAILCISAHWETHGTWVTAMESPKTIHDFYGFPNELYQKTYPAPGAPRWAKLTQGLVRQADVQLDHSWGLDHGTWSVLARMYPDADIPTYQMSLDRTKPAQGHYDLARDLHSLREQGVLIVGSGNIVHNLALVRPGAAPYEWAVDFDERITELVQAREHHALIDYDRLGPSARRSIPTPEHFLPLLYAVALHQPDESVTFLCEEIVFSSVSMRTLVFR